MFGAITVNTETQQDKEHHKLGAGAPAHQLRADIFIQRTQVQFSACTEGVIPVPTGNLIPLASDLHMHIILNKNNESFESHK